MSDAKTILEVNVNIQSEEGQAASRTPHPSEVVSSVQPSETVSPAPETKRPKPSEEIRPLSEAIHNLKITPLSKRTPNEGDAIRSLSHPPAPDKSASEQGSTGSLRPFDEGVLSKLSDSLRGFTNHLDWLVYSLISKLQSIGRAQVPLATSPTTTRLAQPVGPRPAKSTVQSRQSALPPKATQPLIPPAVSAPPHPGKRSLTRISRLIKALRTVGPAKTAQVTSSPSTSSASAAPQTVGQPTTPQIVGPPPSGLPALNQLLQGFIQQLKSTSSRPIQTVKQTIQWLDTPISPQKEKRVLATVRRTTRKAGRAARSVWDFANQPISRAVAKTARAVGAGVARVGGRVKQVVSSRVAPALSQAKQTVSSRLPAGLKRVFDKTKATASGGTRLIKRSFINTAKAGGAVGKAAAQGVMQGFGMQLISVTSRLAALGATATVVGAVGLAGLNLGAVAAATAFRYVTSETERFVSTLAKYSPDLKAFAYLREINKTFAVQAALDKEGPFGGKTARGYIQQNMQDMMKLDQAMIDLEMAFFRAMNRIFGEQGVSGWIEFFSGLIEGIATAIEWTSEIIGNMLSYVQKIFTAIINWLPGMKWLAETVEEGVQALKDMAPKKAPHPDGIDLGAVLWGKNAPKEKGKLKAKDNAVAAELPGDAVPGAGDAGVAMFTNPSMMLNITGSQASSGTPRIAGLNPRFA